LAKCYVSSEIRNLADAYVHKLFDGIAWQDLLPPFVRVGR
jgi:hypothetical protein